MIVLILSRVICVAEVAAGPDFKVGYPFQTTASRRLVKINKLTLASASVLAFCAQLEDDK